ncbi:penicillin-binding transpeptidase domain-containing protein [Vibrio chagasii]|nr:penicillin-binding transpeptidase domain-containing protein [Vibrio chagasii]
MVNRATLGVYPPASTVKPFMAVAGLEEHVISENTIRNEATAYGAFWLNLTLSLARLESVGGTVLLMLHKRLKSRLRSFFYQMAFGHLGIDRISTWMNRFGFGKTIGHRHLKKSSANMPTRDWKMMRYRTPWYQRI